MQPLPVFIGPTIRIGRESWCLAYAGFIVDESLDNSVLYWLIFAYIKLTRPRPTTKTILMLNKQY